MEKYSPIDQSDGCFYGQPDDQFDSWFDDLRPMVIPALVVLSSWTTFLVALAAMSALLGDPS